MKMCPECQYRPSRDQRDQKQDGRCVPCGEKASTRPDAVARKAKKTTAHADAQWAYV